MIAGRSEHVFLETERLGLGAGRGRVRAAPRGLASARGRRGRRDSLIRGCSGHGRGRRGTGRGLAPEAEVDPGGLADHRTHSLSASGHGTLDALTGGYHAAFLVGAIFAVAAAATGAALFTADVRAQAHPGEEAIGAPAVAEVD